MIRLNVDDSEVIIYEKGAYLYSWKIRNKDVLLKGNLELPTKGGMALLIPYANRVAGARYVFNGVEYVLPRKWWSPEEDNAIHGLVFDKEFSIDDVGHNYARLSYVLRHSGYPTTLAINVEYTLYGDELKTVIIVRNIGNSEAPLVVGAHPYFIVSDDWDIEVSGESYRCESINKIPTGRLVRDRLRRGDWDDCFIVNDPIILKSSYSKIIISRENMRYLHVYTGAQSAVALEPMSGAPDAYHNGMGLLIIRPGEKMNFSFTIKAALE